MEPGAAARWIALTAFLVPVASGLLFMALAGAPVSYIAVNMGAAMLVGFALALAPPIEPGPTALLSVAGICLLVIAGSFLGPSIDNVHRWIALGAIQLHVGQLALPSLMVILPRLDKRLAFSIGAAAAILAMLQPDRASAFAILVSTLFLFAYARDRWSLATLIATGLAFGMTAVTPDSLPPVRFVEHVVRDSASIYALLPVVSVFAILLAALAPFAVPCHRRRRSDFVWSACLIGFFLASLGGNYPTPLLGYGTSAILGFGLALLLILVSANRANDAMRQQDRTT